MLEILGEIGFIDIIMSISKSTGNQYGSVENWISIIRQRTHSQLHLISKQEYSQGVANILKMYRENPTELQRIINKDESYIIEIQARKQ